MINKRNFDVQGADELALAGTQAAEQPADGKWQRRWKENKPLVTPWLPPGDLSNGTTIIPPSAQLCHPHFLTARATAASQLNG